MGCKFRFHQHLIIIKKCVHLSKSEDECSQAMSQASKDVFEKSFNNYEKMKSIAQAYTNNRNVAFRNVHMIFYLISGSEKYFLLKSLPIVMYYKKRPRISLNEDQISELTSESTNIYIFK